MKNTLISLAMLKVQMDDQGQTYIDYFVPYFLQVFKRQFNKVDKQNTELDFPEIQNNVKELYGLKIPVDVIKLIIRDFYNIQTHPPNLGSGTLVPPYQQRFCAAKAALPAMLQRSKWVM